MATVFVCAPQAPVYWAEAAWHRDRMVETFLADYPEWYLAIVKKTRKVRIVKNLEHPCQIWTGYVGSKKNPYGYIRAPKAKSRIQFRVHRIIFLKEIGPIGYGFTLHHLCFNKTCIELTHLTPETLAKNVSLGDGKERIISTACPHGHLFEGNATVIRNGYLICNTCVKIRNQARDLLVVAAPTKLGMPHKEFRKVYGKGLPQMIDILGEKDIVDLLMDKCPPENLKVLASQSGKGKRGSGQSLLAGYAATALRRLTANE